ncbi:hypothetical protein P280DRAFT_392815 [Massarina eburnea CBS 473.64]|uniref:Zn(2)-C6 fungal-type domain-containing protein n=1 Tax=Massarina eburnea CBS 473.64 TaxID=1395130 RepID=A0A6A6S9G5_9PLEO|nr:hypothetical protein P280DRAFT_392815 [Massarina eburnea CBS 473.64]
MNANSIAGRSRSFGGCATCRNRHMKCDEARPTCSMCKNAGVVCNGYEKSIFFDFEAAPQAGSLRFRRPLLTEKERQSMSVWLTSSVPSRTVLRNLYRIDEESEAVPTSHAVQISRGPFGAFRLGSTAASAISPLQNSPKPGELLPTDNSSDLADMLPIFDQPFYSFESTDSPDSQDLVQPSFNQPQQGGFPSNLDIFDAMLGSNRFEEIFDDVPAPEESPFINAQPSHTFHFPPSSFSQINPSNSNDPNDLALSFGSAVPSDAVFLLKHYQSNVLPILTPFRHSKTPWHVLFVPHVKNCLAALTLGESIDNASFCAFYGILAISAFSIGGMTQNSMWLDQGGVYKQKAREHARSMLQTAYDVPKAAKYKSVLMALLTMVQISIVTGNRDQTECYFLEAEKLIRLNGLKRRKSRKVRLLHHCYAFERILYESTMIGTSDTSQRNHVRKAIQSSGLAHSQDSLSFCLSSWRDLSQDMMRVKGQEEGENDLHLQYPGIWKGTLHPEIFGIPEPWLLLLSLVIRLAREREGLTQDGRTETLSAKEFLNRAKAIEVYIESMRTNRQTPENSVGTNLEHILDALQHALSIYFYRRIYDIDSAMLQHRVETIRDCLLRCDCVGSEQMYGSARLVWPAFIAASEADSLELQSSFSQWFEVSAQRSGLRLFSDTLENLQRIWAHKRNSHGMSVSWIDTMESAVAS